MGPQFLGLVLIVDVAAAMLIRGLSLVGEGRGKKVCKEKCGGLPLTVST